MPYRILALDGGGARALIPVALVQRLQERRGEFLDRVDLFAGTSTSGITALVLAAAEDWDESAESARTFWVEAKKFYETNSFRTVAAVTGRASYFDNKALEAIVRRYFGDRTIGDLRRKIVVPTVVLRSEGTPDGKPCWAPELIHNFDGSFADLPLWEAALRAAALPIVFPVRHDRIDGSLVANNPSLCAVAKALEAGAAKLADLRVLSIGAGQNPLALKAGNADWGYADWLFDLDAPLVLLQAIAENNGRLTDFHCEQLLSAARYHRIDSQLPKPVKIDEHNPRFLVQLGDVADLTDVQPTLAWLDRCDWDGSRPARASRKPAT